jgi:hypothetical protein
MIKIFLLLAAFITPLVSYALIQPQYLLCEFNVEALVLRENLPRISLKKGSHRLTFNEIVSLKFHKNNEKIAKLFPQNGFDFILFNKKKYFVNTNKKFYWSVSETKNPALEIIRCEVRQ